LTSVSGQASLTNWSLAEDSMHLWERTKRGSEVCGQAARAGACLALAGYYFIA
jgi:hypothetical protein